MAISGLMVFGSLTIERIQIGPMRDGPRNSSEAIAQIHLVWSLFFLFTATAFTSDAVLRDDATRFGPIIRATPLRERDYLLGRFLGSFLAVAAAFLSVPAGLWLATWAPWLDPASLVPTRIGDYLFAVLVLALPNLFLASALFFALATATRSIWAAYLGAVGLLVAYGLGTGSGEGMPGGRAAAVLEPFGFAALAQGGAVLTANRLLWIAVAAGALGATLALFRFRAPPRPAKPDRPGKSLPAPAPSSEFRHRPRFGPGVALAQVAARTRLEIGQVVRSPVFLVLVLIGAVNAALTLWKAGGGGPLTTGLAIAELETAFRLVPFAVVLFYAGEIVWAERERRVHEIVGASPIPDWAVLGPKAAALASVVLATLAAGVATAVAVQAARHPAAIDLALYARSYLAPRGYEWLLFAALALAIQALSPGKLAGWGWTVLYLIVSLAAEQLGWTSSLYRYGGHPDALASGVAGFAGVAAAAWIRVYWIAFAGLLLLAAHLAMGRGVETRFASRARRIPRRLRGPAGLLAATIGLVWLGAGLALLVGPA